MSSLAELEEFLKTADQNGMFAGMFEDKDAEGSGDGNDRGMERIRELEAQRLEVEKSLRGLDLLSQASHGQTTAGSSLVKDRGDKLASSSQPATQERSKRQPNQSTILQVPKSARAKKIPFGLRPETAGLSFESREPQLPDDDSTERVSTSPPSASGDMSEEDTARPEPRRGKGKASRKPQLTDEMPKTVDLTSNAASAMGPIIHPASRVPPLKELLSVNKTVWPNTTPLGKAATTNASSGEVTEQGTFVPEPEGSKSDLVCRWALPLG